MDDAMETDHYEVFQSEHDGKWRINRQRMLGSVHNDNTLEYEFDTEDEANAKMAELSDQ